MSTQTDYGRKVYYIDLDGLLACGEIEAIRSGPHWAGRQWVRVDGRWVDAAGIRPMVMPTPRAA
jgi:hypothetical protein